MHPNTESFLKRFRELLRKYQLELFEDHAVSSVLRCCQRVSGTDTFGLTEFVSSSLGFRDTWAGLEFFLKEQNGCYALIAQCGKCDAESTRLVEGFILELNGVVAAHGIIVDYVHEHEANNHVFGYSELAVYSTTPPREESHDSLQHRQKYLSKPAVSSHRLSQHRRAEDSNYLTLKFGEIIRDYVLLHEIAF
jgi:hypothetical protein